MHDNGFRNRYVSKYLHLVLQAAQGCPVKILFHSKTPVVELYYSKVTGLSYATLL